LDFTPHLSVYLPSDGYCRFHLGDLQSLIVEPLMDHCPAFVCHSFFILEVDPKANDTFLQFPKREHDVIV
jgi:hypothetical protein